MVSTRKYRPFWVSISISDLNQNSGFGCTIHCGESTGKKIGKSYLCALMSHIRALSPNSVTLKCAIHYLPKESEFGRPKNKWNILGIICPKFFWSHIFIFLFSTFSWTFQIPSLTAKYGFWVTSYKIVVYGCEVTLLQYFSQACEHIYCKVFPIFSKNIFS